MKVQYSPLKSTDGFQSQEKDAPKNFDKIWTQAFYNFLQLQTDEWSAADWTELDE